VEPSFPLVAGAGTDHATAGPRPTQSRAGV